MMPMTPPPAGQPTPPPTGAGGPSQTGSQDIEMQLVALLKQAASLAAKNGIDFASLVAKVLGGGPGGGTTPTPAPPMPK